MTGDCAADGNSTSNTSRKKRKTHQGSVIDLNNNDEASSMTDVANMTRVHSEIAVASRQNAIALERNAIGRTQHALLGIKKCTCQLEQKVFDLEDQIEDEDNANRKVRLEKRLESAKADLEQEIAARVRTEEDMNKRLEVLAEREES